MPTIGKSAPFARRFDIEEQRKLLTSKGLEVRSIQWSASPNGCATFIAHQPGLDLDGPVVMTELPRTWDDRGYKGRGRTGHWFAVRASTDEDVKAGVAGLLTFDVNRSAAEGAIQIGYAEAWLIPVPETDEAEEAFGSIANLF